MEEPYQQKNQLRPNRLELNFLLDGTAGSRALRQSERQEELSPLSRTSLKRLQAAPAV